MAVVHTWPTAFLDIIIKEVDTVTVERKKLYQQVWSIPGQQLAIMYGISDVGLAKACKRYNVPRPPRGYWARRAAGQKVRRPPLPKCDSVDEKVHFSGWNMSEVAMQNAAKTNRSSSATALGGELHPAVAKLGDAILSAPTGVDGLLTVGEFDIRISAAVRDRCVSVLDALAKHWVSRSGVVSFDEGPVRQIQLAVGSDHFSVQVTENIDESKPATDPTRLTGNLCLTIKGDERREFRRRWSDTKSQRLERMLPQLVETVMNVITLVRDERLDQECVSRQHDKISRIRQRSNRDESQEFYWRQELSQRVDRWHEADRMRAYLNAIKAAVDSGRVTPQNDEGFAKWYDWATRYADSIDPIVNGQLPGGRVVAKENVTVDKLDLTVATKETISSLGAVDTDALWKLKQDVVRAACKGKFGRTWNEISRVLECQGYDVSKREVASDWW